MKILFTGGGTGGHFYPIIAVAEQINKIKEIEKILTIDLFYMASDPYDKKVLNEQGISFIQVSSGKMRLYFSVQNFLDLFKTFFGIITAILKMYQIYPDVVFSKGGYDSFPSLVAARILGIPVVIHESDSVPGKVSLWSGRFAKRVAISYPETIKYFSKEKTAWTGQPIRADLMYPQKEGVFEYLKMKPSIPILLILGGSQGSEIINNTILEALPSLVSKYQIIHQVGVKNIADVKLRTELILKDNPNQGHYQAFDFLGPLAMKMSAGAASLVISRAGSTIFEIALWGAPSIIIPITHSNGDHQNKNAFNYARAGGCIVVEESNLTPHLLEAEIDNLLNDKDKIDAMKKSAREFAHPEAANKIAKEIIKIGLSHEEN